MDHLILESQFAHAINRLSMLRGNQPLPIPMSRVNRGHAEYPPTLDSIEWFLAVARL